jgi:sugar lactone lactonase YvrE
MNALIRFLGTAFLAVFSNTSYADAPVLLPKWETPAIFEQPESVVWDTQRQVLYVSNVNGSPLEFDNNGYIAQLNLDGELINKQWITGLNAPKGMVIKNDILYVTDINELVLIDLKKQKIHQRYKAADAHFLNDITVDDNGIIYVSDMFTNRIYTLKDNTFSVWLDDSQLASPNGLFIEDNQLIVGSWGVMTEGFATQVPGHLKTVSLTTKEIHSLGNGNPVGNLDGVESDGKGNFLVTDWMNGKLFFITPDGLSQTLLSFHPGSADHTVLLEKDMIIVPMMQTGHITAFTIKK